MTAPEWDAEQLEVINDAPSSWQLVTAGPGAGKSAVACQRVAYLIDQGLPASKLLLVSFTRTAVGELRERIVSYAVAGDEARRVRISTIDSHAWSLRAGFEDATPSPFTTRDSFELSIARTVKLLREGNPQLREFLSTLEHLIIDEAQDVMSARAELIMEILRALEPSCGVTVLADPAQAIYGFTVDDNGDVTREAKPLLSLLETQSPKPFVRRRLNRVHRIKNPDLADLFLRARREIELASAPDGHVNRVRETIRNACGNDVGVSTHENIAAFLSRIRNDSTLVLYRQRADVLFASSFCSQAGVEHRLRMSDVPVAVKPWIGWLLCEFTPPIINRSEFEELWRTRNELCEAPFRAENVESAWALLHRIAAAKSRHTLDLEHLRRIVARGRPPSELVQQDLGYRGPILGTIHASKGREADTVVLVMPSPAFQGDLGENSDQVGEIFEEGRVLYVGATRARKILITAAHAASPVGRLGSGRVYRVARNSLIQFEIGRNGDVDSFAHLAWESSLDIQHCLAQSVGATTGLLARVNPEQDYVWRLSLNQIDVDGVTKQVEVGQLSRSFDYDIKQLWGRVDQEQRLRPPGTIPYVYLAGVTTVGVGEDERWSVKHPFNHSRLALAPIVKGFAPVQFIQRGSRRAKS